MATEKEILTRGIIETKDAIRDLEGNGGAVIVAVAGIFLLFIVSIIGVLVILGAIIWYLVRTSEYSNLKSEQFRLELELARVEEKESK